MSELDTLQAPTARIARKRIGILCLSAIPDDPRVRRQGDLMTEAGWDVVAIGLPGHRSSDPAWTCFAIDTAPRMLTEAAAKASNTHDVSDADPSENSGATQTNQITEPQSKTPRQLLTERLAQRLNGYGVPALVQPYLLSVIVTLMPAMRRGYSIWRLLRVNLQPSYAAASFWRVREDFNKIYELGRRHEVDLWLANDWTTLPIAARLATEQAVPYCYDTHELAVDEYAQSLKWRLLNRALIKGAEGSAIRGAAFVTCVSDGIADRLREIYRLGERPIVIRNMPQYQRHAPRAVGETIRVLYHGIVAPGRGLEASIRSVALWRPEFHLTIRGPIQAAYKAELERIARESNVSDRITFDPPVPMTDLVARAAAFDIGLFALPDYSKQNVYVLPNKFFEYTMAGLALCVSDLPEMASLLKRHDLGQLIPHMTPRDIAEAINGFDRLSLARYKANAADAATVLNWEAEAERLVQIINQTI